MRAGALRQRAVIQRLTTVPNTTGSPFQQEQWVPYVENVPVELNALRGREFWEARRENAETVARIRMRYISGITTDMRVIVDGRTFDIIPPIDNVGGRNAELVLLVREVT
jgi:SPP1 family predicted phage head-tail adaptor